MNSFSHFPDFAIINLVPIFILKMIPRKEQEPRKKMNLRPDRWTGARAPPPGLLALNSLSLWLHLQGHGQEGTCG